MDEKEWKVEVMACDPHAFNKKTFSELLTDVNSLTHTDHKLMEACDRLAESCQHLIGIHRGTYPNGSNSELYQISRSPGTSGLLGYSQRECGEGESSDEVPMETCDPKPRCLKYMFDELQNQTSQHSGPRNCFLEKSSSLRREGLHMKIMEGRSGRNEEGRGNRYPSSAYPHNINQSNTIRELPKERVSAQRRENERHNADKPLPKSSKKFSQNEELAMKKVDASSELTSKLNDSMNLLRDELDKIFNSSLDLAHEGKVADSIFDDLDEEATREAGFTPTCLNLTDQGYFSDCSNLDGPRAGLSSTPTSPSSLTLGHQMWPSAESSPIPSSPSRGYIRRSGELPPGSVYASPRMYPESIVRNPLSPRSAFKKVVRFS